MRYLEFLPPDDLAAWVECFWVFESGNLGPMVETIVADGFPELIVHFGNPYCEQNSTGGLTIQSRSVVSGQITGPLILHTPCEAGIFSIRFRPAGMSAFTAVPMKLTTDVRVSAEDLFESGSGYSNEVSAATSDEQRVKCATQFLRAALIRTEKRCPTSSATAIIKAMQGQVSIEALATKLNMGRRNLELRFLKDVGVSPKRFCRIIRFRRAFDLLTDVSSSASKVALEAGFYDQSHLIHEFKEFAGTSPLEFLNQNAGLSHSLLNG